MWVLTCMERAELCLIVKKVKVNLLGKHRRRLLHKRFRMICRRTNNANFSYIFNNSMTPKNMHTYHFIIFNKFQHSFTHEKWNLSQKIWSRTPPHRKNRNVHKHENRDIQKKVYPHVYCFGNNAKKKRKNHNPIYVSVIQNEIYFIFFHDQQKATT